MSNPHSTAPKPKCTPCLGFLLVGLVLLVVAFGWVVKVVEKVFSGAGMEHCCTIEGEPFSFLPEFFSFWVFQLSFCLAWFFKFAIGCSGAISSASTESRCPPPQVKPRDTVAPITALHCTAMIITTVTDMLPNTAVERDRRQAGLAGSLRGFAAPAAPHLRRWAS